MGERNLIRKLHSEAESKGDLTLPSLGAWEEETEGGRRSRREETEGVEMAPIPAPAEEIVDKKSNLKNK